MYESILLPTDGSRDMGPVIDQAVDLASLCNASIHALHVVDERAYLSVPDDARDRVRETLESDGNSFTKSVAEQALTAGIDIKRELRWGDPAPAILSYAVENDIDLIMMGTHGRIGYERYLLGSVAEKVVRISPVPVLTIAVGDTENQKHEILKTPTTDPPITEDTNETQETLPTTTETDTDSSDSQ